MAGESWEWELNICRREWDLELNGGWRQWELELNGGRRELGVGDEWWQGRVGSGS